jgi:hypothetical protein
VTGQESNKRAVISEMTILTFDLGHPSDRDARVPDPAYFGFAIWVLLGFSGEGVQRFDVFACTPRWLADNFTRYLHGAGRWAVPYVEEPETLTALFVPGLVLMPEWSSDHLRRSIEKICEECEGPDWITVAQKLSGWMPWEYTYRY